MDCEQWHVVYKNNVNEFKLLSSNSHGHILDVAAALFLSAEATPHLLYR